MWLAAGSLWSWRTDEQQRLATFAFTKFPLWIAFWKVHCLNCICLLGEWLDFQKSLVCALRRKVVKDVMETKVRKVWRARIQCQCHLENFQKLIFCWRWQIGYWMHLHLKPSFGENRHFQSVFECTLHVKILMQSTEQHSIPKIERVELRIEGCSWERAGIVSSSH